MATPTLYNTGNPVPSDAVKDLSDNAVHFDEVLNSDSPSFTDRLGRRRETLTGLQAEFDEDQAQRAALFAQFLNSLADQDLGMYAAGITLTRRNQVFQRAGIYYRAAATTVLPYTTTGDWATESSKFVLAGDNLLRGDLTNSTDPLKGITLIGASERVLADIPALRAYPKTGSQRVMTGDVGGHWVLDPVDSTSAEDLNKGILVAADGGRWKTIAGSSRAQKGMPGTTFNDWGWVWGYNVDGVQINGNGNKFNYFSLYIDHDRVVQQQGLNGATGSKVVGLNVTMLSGGLQTRGGRHAIEGTLLQGFGSDGIGDPNNQDRFRVAVQGTCLTDTGDGGTGPLDTRAYYSGISAFSGVLAGEYIDNLTGGEINTQIYSGPGTAVRLHTGIQIASNVGQRGFGLDTALSVSQLAGRGWAHILAIHGLNGAPAMEADSKVIKIFTTGTGSGAIDSVIETTGINVNALIRAEGVLLRSGSLDMFAPGSTVSLGSGGIPSSVQLQAKSSGLNGSYDGRLAFTGGSATPGSGTAQLDAGLFATSATTIRGTVSGGTSLGSAAYPMASVWTVTAPNVTSDLRKKKNIKPLSLGLEFVNSLAAAEQGLIEFELANNGQTEFEEVVVGEREEEVQVEEEYDETRSFVEMVEGVATLRTVTETKTRPLFDTVQVYNEDGSQAIISAKKAVGKETVIDPETGEEKTAVKYEMVDELYTMKVPVMKTVKVPVTEMRSKPTTGERTHLGMGAQVIGEQLKKFGLDNCAAWCLADKDDPESDQSIRETQLISVLLKAVAELSDKVDKLTAGA